MTTLTLTEKQARKLYDTSPNELKWLMETTFGKDFHQVKITERVKTFEDACTEIGEDPNDEKFQSGEADEIAYRKLKVIARSLNEGWTPDWNNSNQRKWFPYFYMDKPGFRFVVSGYSSYGANAAGGSRLCLKSEELSNYSANQFLDIYKDLIA